MINLLETIQDWRKARLANADPLRVHFSGTLEGADRLFAIAIKISTNASAPLFRSALRSEPSLAFWLTLESPDKAEEPEKEGDRRNQVDSGAQYGGCDSDGLYK